LNEKKKSRISESEHPEILDVEEKEIPYQKPPNDNIIYHNLSKKAKKKR
jgi:hypothetical protein